MKACMRISQKTQKVLKLGLTLTSTRLLLNMKVLWSSHLSFKGFFFWVENKQMTIQLPNPSGIYTKKIDTCNSSDKQATYHNIIQIHNNVM